MGKPQSTGNLVNALAQDSSNNIGIGGAANASFKLQVTGTSLFTDGTQGLNIRAYTGGAGFGAIYSSGVTAGAGNFALAASATQTILSGVDNVNLAINSAIKLAIASTGAATFSSSVSATSANLSGNVVFNRASTSAGNNIEWRTANTLNWYIGTRGLVNNNFYIVNEGLGANNLILDASTGAATFSGFVGINGSPGTGFPLEAYINSSTAYTTSSRGNVMRLYNSNTSANIFAGIELGGAGTANDGLAGLNAVVTGSGSGALTFYTRDSNTFAERLRITSSGIVGIGVVPNSWFTGAGYKVLELGAGLSLDSGNDFRARIASNAFVNSGGDWAYRNTSQASNYSQFQGNHIWETASSGTAGSAITFTERMRITSGGNVLFNGSDASGWYAGFSNSSTNFAYMGATAQFANSGGISTDFGIRSANAMAFYTSGGNERLRIASGGQILMNTTSILTAGWLCIAVASDNHNAIVLKDTGTSYSSGNYYQIFTNSTNAIVGGIIHNTATTVNYWTGPSDQRLKSNIQDVEESVLPLFNDVKLKTYNHTADEDESVIYKGFIAQEMVDKFPEAYGLNKEGYYMYNPNGYIPYLIKAIQELTQKVNALENK